MLEWKAKFTASNAPITLRTLVSNQSCHWLNLRPGQVLNKTRGELQGPQRSGRQHQQVATMVWARSNAHNTLPPPSPRGPQLGAMLVSNSQENQQNRLFWLKAPPPPATHTPLSYYWIKLHFAIFAGKKIHTNDLLNHLYGKANYILFKIKSVKTWDISFHIKDTIRVA